MSIVNLLNEIEQKKNERLKTGKVVGPEAEKLPSVKTTVALEQPKQLTIQEKIRAGLPTGETIGKPSANVKPLAEATPEEIKKISETTGEKEKSVAKIAAEEKKVSQMTPGEKMAYDYNKTTDIMQELHPEKIDPLNFVKRGLTFGWGAGYISDMPSVEPVTTKQKVFQSVGNIISMTFLSRLLSPALGAIASKIPGAATPLKVLSETVAKHPWSVGYPLNVAKSATWGALFGAITKAENKRQWAKNVVNTAGTFAAFEVLAYPIVQFFKPVFYEIKSGKMTGISKEAQTALQENAEPLNQIFTQEQPIWFKSEADPNQLIKVTKSSIDLIPARTSGINPSDIKTIPFLKQADIEVFQTKPSLYNRLKDILQKPSAPKMTTPPTGIPETGVPPTTGTTPTAGPTPNVPTTGPVVTPPAKPTTTPNIPNAIAKSTADIVNAKIAEIEAKKVKAVKAPKETTVTEPLVEEKVETFPTAQEAKTVIEKEGAKSIYRTPYTQQDFVISKILKGEPIPPDLNYIAIEIYNQGAVELTEDGTGTQIDMTGMFMKNEETANEKDIYGMKFLSAEEGGLDKASYEEVNNIKLDEVDKMDPNDLQAGWGVTTSLKTGDVIESNEIPAKKVMTSGKNKGKEVKTEGYGVIEDIYDDGSVLVKTDKGFQKINFYNAKEVDVETISANDKTLIQNLGKNIEAVSKEQKETKAKITKKAKEIYEIVRNEPSKDPNYPKFEPAEFMELSAKDESKISELEQGLQSVIAPKGKEFTEQEFSEIEASNEKIQEQINKIKSKEHLAVRVGDYIINDDGYPEVATTGNAQYIDGTPENIKEKPNQYLTDINIAGIRARYLRDTENVDFGEYTNQIRKATEEEIKIAKEYESGITPEITKTIRESKGLSADDIMQKYPDINLKRDVAITDIHGEKKVIPEGEALTPYELKGNKVLLQDGETYIVSKNQFQNIKGNAVKAEAKEFAPELKGTEETIKGISKNTLTPQEKIRFEELGKKVDNGSIVGEDKVEYQKLKEKSGTLIDTKVKFSGWQLPGGENYREVLIRVPIDTSSTLTELPKGTKTWKVGNSGALETPNGQRMTFDLNGGDLDELALKALNENKAAMLGGGGFKSAHWDEKNVISHLRLNDRIYDGKKVLFVEELQSDWALEARKQGTTTDKELKWNDRRDGALWAEVGSRYFGIDKEGDKFYVFEKNGVLGQTVDTIEKAKKLAQEQASKNVVPSNALLKNWQELSVKRALKEAVDSGSDIMAWTNGEQQKARYNLAKEIKSIDWKTGEKGKSIVIEPKSGEPFGIGIDEQGKINVSLTKTEWEGKNLGDVIGKGITEKILAEPKGNLSGEGLNVGGQWAVNLYDKQLPVIVKNITGITPKVIDMGLPVDKPKHEIKWHNGSEVTPSDINGDTAGGYVSIDGENYVITKIIGDGKFQAVEAMSIPPTLRVAFANGTLTAEQKKSITDIVAEDFDVSVKPSAGQQSIEITPEIKAMVKGEAPTLKKPSGVEPFKQAEIKKVSDNLLKNNPDIIQKDAEAMARDVIKNRKFNQATKGAEVKVGDTITLQSKSGKTDTIKVTKITDKQYIGIGKEGTSMGLPLGFAKDKWSIIEKPAEPVKKQPKPAKTMQPTIKTTQTRSGKKEVPAQEFASKIMPKKPTIPTLGAFMVKDGVLSATDLEMALRLKSDLKDGLYRMVGKNAIPVVPSDGMEVKDFPIIPEVKGEPAFTALNENLTAEIKTAMLSISKNEIRPEITGIRVEVDGKSIKIFSTDAFRLYHRKVYGKVAGKAEFIIGNVDKLAKVLPAVGPKVDITYDEKNGLIKFSGANGEIVARKIEGDYPKLDQVYPEFTKQYIVGKSDMENALKELKPFADEDPLKAVEIDVEGNYIKLKNIPHTKDTPTKEVKILMRDSDVEIPSNVQEGVLVMPMLGVSGESSGITRLNHKYITDAVNSLDSETIHFYTPKKADKSPSLFTDKDKWELNLTKEPKQKAPSGIASGEGSKIGTFEELAGIQDKSPEQFKIYEKIKALIDKYALTIGEGYLPRNALGVYYRGTKNIRISGMNALSIASHEITHFLDFAYKISQRLMGIRGYASNGNALYSKDTAKLRKEMTDIYERYYPGAKRTHKLEKRMLEGFAVLLQKYISQPTTIASEYPYITKAFLTPQGEFYEPVIGDIIKDLQNIVVEYQGLKPLDKIGARVVNGKVNVNKDSFLNFFDKFKTEFADQVYPIEKLAKLSGTHFTVKDPSLWIRQWNNSNAIILNNIKGDRGYWGWRNGEMKKLHDYNWKNFVGEMQQEKVAEELGYYLVARREYFLYKELNAMAKDDPARVELQKILDNDGFTEKEVTDAYLENKDRFAEIEKKYDVLVREDLNFLSDNQVQLLSPEEYTKMVDKEGYASFKRYIYDEVVGEEGGAISGFRVGRTKVSSLLKRTGSQKPIINPVYSAIKNHAEATRKGLKQIVYNRMYAISDKFPELFQQLQLKVIPSEGRLMFPQEKDPNIIMARSGYDRKPILVDSTIKRTIDELLNHTNLSVFERLLMGSSRFFTKGTTGLFPGFAITNYTVDQVTAIAQTRNNYIPIYDPLKKLVKMLNPENQEHLFLQEYLVMGGERQTFVGWQDLSPNELFDAIAKERQGILKIVDWANAGASFLALPSQWSEIMTRATEYIKSRQAGKTAIVALEEAGRVTAPFHHIGRWGGGRVGQTFIKSIPFFNPAIQVLAQAGETLNTPEGRKRYLFTALAVIATSIAATGLVLSVGTEEQKQLYSDIHPDELNKYIWLPNPNGKDLIKIRVPDQMEFIATLINMAWTDKKLQSNYTAGEYLNAGLSWLPSQFDISQPEKMLMSWVPQLIKPGVLTLAGVKDFPKIMPMESQLMQSRSPEYRYNETTSPVAKWLGSTLKMSPIKIDYLLTGYLGRASGFITGKPGIYNPLKSMNREYYFTSGRKLNSYYDLREKNDNDYYDYTHKLKTFSKDEVKEIINQRGKISSIYELLKVYRTLDEKTQPKTMQRLRNQILEKVDKL